MTKSLSLAVFAAGLLAATSAFAQMYPGEGITVNPQAAYTAGPYGPYKGTIQLKPPSSRKTVHHAVKKAAPAEAEAAPSPPPAAMPDLSESAPTETASAPPPKPKKVKAAETTPPPAPVESEADQSGGIPLSLAPNEPQPIAPQKPRKMPKQASIAPAAPPAQADAAPQPPAASGLSKHSEILFARGATDPGTATINKLHGVASQLSSLLTASAGRVQLDAYGGKPGDKGSDARRLSLKRALVIRQILIEDGIPSDRIDVRAMGGIDDNGAPDRVDVYVSAG
ncbi:MAG TPA: OmpA family protein [Rhizomicrobium sp.]|nr:OmpA family protein [Rhizomicrobium sp.]